VSRIPADGHPLDVPASRLAFSLAIAALLGCVEETTVIDGDQRAQLACGEATLLFTPPSGCTTVRVESVSPYGCAVRDFTGMPVDDHVGSWVRLARAADRPATLTVALLSSASVCTLDGGASACPATITFAGVADPPCACVLGDLETIPITIDTPVRYPIFSPARDVLLEPLGASFELTLCDDLTSP